MDQQRIGALSDGSLRADAARNRRQIIESASRVFAERGLDAPMDEIARLAEVGNATLYRRFPSRCDLVTAVYEETLRDVVEAADRALGATDPWEGFKDHLTYLCRLQADNRALADLLTMIFPTSPQLQRLQQQALDGLTALVDRAKSGDDLREDFRHEDVVLILMANAGLLERTVDAVPLGWQRHLHFVLQGLRQTASADSPQPAGPTRTKRAMRQLAARHGLE